MSLSKEKQAKLLAKKAEKEAKLSLAREKEGDWGKPLCFSEKLSLPVFPVECLPESLRDYVISVAESRQVPVDLPALLACAVAATAAARKYRVYIGDSHDEPTNIWVVVALPSGSRKSGVFEDLQKPLATVQKRLYQQLEPKIKEAMRRQKIFEKRLDKLSSDAAKAPTEDKRKEIEEQIYNLEKNAVTVPIAPTLFVSGDITPEAVAEKLGEQNGRLAIMDTEGGIFAIIAGRYDALREANLDVFLKGHAGDYLRVDRKNKLPIDVTEPALTMGLAVQPDVIKDLAVKKAFRTRGLLGRFLYSLPESLIGTRKYEGLPIDPLAEEKYLRAIETIFSIPMPKATEGCTRLPHYRLFIKGEALESWVAFYDEIEERQARGGDLADMTDWASKLAGAVARLSGVLHVVDTGGDPSLPIISADTVAKACEIGRYFIEHAKAAFGLMACTANERVAREILRWALEKKRATFTLRDFWAENRSKAKCSDDLLPAFELLEDRDLLREIVENKPSGRRAKHRYALNPFCLACRQCLEKVSDKL